jgi:spermidine/putrescine-binding protein
VPITGSGGYGVDVTETPDQPTLADVLAAIGALALKVEGIDNKTDDLTEATAASFGHVMTEIGGVKADVADLRTDLRNTEVALAARIDAVGHVIRTAKEDVARHLADPGAHPHRHAA